MQIWLVLRKAKKRQIRVVIVVVKEGQVRLNTVDKKG